MGNCKYINNLVWQNVCVQLSDDAKKAYKVLYAIVSITLKYRYNYQGKTAINTQRILSMATKI